MKHCLLLFAFLLLVNFSFAQTAERNALPERRPGEMLVQLEPGSDIKNLLPAIRRQVDTYWWYKKAVAAEWNIHLLGYEEFATNPEAVLEAVRRTPGIQSAQFNHRAVERSIEPNDPEWWRQDDMTLIGAPDAWESSTGGLTGAGDTIVVAILEKGILLTHPDIAPNRWYNRAETPGNDLDDDNNGYADDYGGWDARNGGDGTGGNNNHGTAVTGIVGARGNNALGVTGVNWNVKLMGISNVEYEDEIIGAYNYAGKARRLYNQTNGAKGAFVVATNASFGLDKEHAAEHPLWCAVYDSLGKVGILSVGATTNANVNVDIEGDMPTSCASEFLITVNNVNKLGSKSPATGYGAVSIDLGAPGNETYTTANAGLNNPTYGTLGGTSSATPHVTGAVALLYSMPCDLFTQDALTQPADCARRVRDIILDHVEPEATLDGITTTGGYLHIGNSLEAVLDLCGGLAGPLDILKVETIGRDFYRVYYQTPTFDEYQFRVFNMLGQLMYEQEVTPQQFGVNYVEYDGSDLAAGVYVMSIGRNKDVTSRKFPKF